MKFDCIHEMAKLNDYWSRVRTGKDRHPAPLLISGVRGCGKTKLVQEYVRMHDHARYFSFRYLSSTQALSAFAEDFLPDKKAPQTWQEACAEFAASVGKRFVFVFLDDLDFFHGAEEFCAAWNEMTDRETHIASAYLRREHGKHGLRDVALSYRTLADFCRALPEYDRADVVRLYALTGGIPAAAQETDANLRFEGNLMRLLVYDSAFSRLLPQWMQESFRSPESYYPILDSIAGGHHRLSEIARDVGYAGNKCKTYLDALCQADFVALENREYRLKNSYYKAWCLYVYEGRRMQIGNARVLLDRVKATVDEQIAMPVFRESCLRYMLKADRDYLREGRQGELKRDEIVNVPGMGKVKLDFCFLLPHCSLIGVCPESLEAHITKETAAKIIYAVKEYYSLHDTDIVLFSAGRFSDWCVHQAAQLYWLHEVTTERLRY